MTKKRSKGGSVPKFVVTPEVIENVGKLAGLGMTIELIANYYGIHKDTWYEHAKKNPDLMMAAKKGKAAGVSFVAGKLMEQVRKGKLSAIIFYLKTQAHFSEYLKVEGDGKPAAPALTLNVTDPIEAAKIYQQIMLGS